MRSIEKSGYRNRIRSTSEFHEESGLTSADAEKAYWLIREQSGKIAAKSALMRFLKANGFATIRWRVLLAEMRGKGNGIIRRVLRLCRRVQTAASGPHSRAKPHVRQSLCIRRRGDRARGEARGDPVAVRARPCRRTTCRAGDRIRLRRHVLPLVARCCSRHASACNRQQTSRSSWVCGRHLLSVRRAFAVGSQRVTLLMDSDSHSETTRQRIAALLDGRAVDFLFIHRAHSCEGAWQDFRDVLAFCGSRRTYCVPRYVSESGRADKGGRTVLARVHRRARD